MNGLRAGSHHAPVAFQAKQHNNYFTPLLGGISENNHKLTLDVESGETSKIAQLSLTKFHHPAPNPIKLRDYQARMLRQIYRWVRKGERRILAIAVMGAGKTVLASKIMADAIAKGKRAVFLVSLNCLLDQTANTLERFGVYCSILQGDRHHDPDAPAVVASSQTIRSRLRRGEDLDEVLGTNIGVVFLDEAHITAWDSTYQAIADWLPETPIIGLTATPWRLSRKQWLGQKFTACVVGPQPPDIIRMGGAVLARLFRLGGAINKDNLSQNRGDYSDSSIAKEATKAESLAIIYRGWEQHCSDRPSLMVGATVHQAQTTAAYFIERGVRAEVITGGTSRRDRTAIIHRLATGETKLICSVGCLTAGFDCPPVSAILFVRKTKSRALFHQVCGRGSRPHPGKTDYLILDFGDNKAHGNPMAEQDYDIGEPKQREPQDATKVCPSCNAVISIFAQVCPECGHEFEGDGDEEKEPDFIYGDLAERFTKEQRSQIQELRAARKQAFAADQHPSLPIQSFIDRHGFTPPSDWTTWAALGRRNASLKRRGEYLDYLHRHAPQNNHQTPWLAYQCQLEFGCGHEQLMALPYWWDVLQIPPDSGPDHIQEAYRRATLTAHTEKDFHRLNSAIASAKHDIQGAG